MWAGYGMTLGLRIGTGTGGSHHTLAASVSLVGRESSVSALPNLLAAS